MLKLFWFFLSFLSLIALGDSTFNNNFECSSYSDLQNKIDNANINVDTKIIISETIYGEYV